jgi:hypothetical protein
MRRQDDDRNAVVLVGDNHNNPNVVISVNGKMTMMAVVADTHCAFFFIFPISPALKVSLLYQ